MHTLDCGNGWTANHNGDFSGPVLIVAPATVRPFGNRGDRPEVEIPVHVVVAIAAALVRQEKIRTLEDATDLEIMMGRAFR